MVQSTRDNTKTSKKRPAETGTLVGVRFQPADLERLDDWIVSNGAPFVTRPEAVRRIIKMALNPQST